jgi:hypothetical protein
MITKSVEAIDDIVTLPPATSAIVTALFSPIAPLVPLKRTMAFAVEDPGPVKFPETATVEITTLLGVIMVWEKTLQHTARPRSEAMMDFMY